MTETNADKIRRLENEVKRLKKQLKGLQLKIALREGLSIAKGHEGYHKAVYNGSNTAVKKNDEMLTRLHSELHAWGRFPTVKNSIYKNAAKHVKHKNSPTGSSESVYENRLTNHARKLKNISEKGSAVTKKGKKIERQSTPRMQRAVSAPMQSGRGSGKR